MKRQFEGRTIDLPDLMIVGAAKSGTTTLYRLLADHPEIHFPDSVKEPFYFCFGGQEPQGLDLDLRKWIVWKTEDYLNLYRSHPSEVLLADASTAYLYKFEESIAHMKELYGEDLGKVKIMMILRNPVDRAYSHYTYLVRNGFENLPFEEAIKEENITARREKRWGFDYLNYGAYAAQVKAYLEHFNEVDIFLTSELREEQILIDKICSSLKIAPFEVRKGVKANPSGMPKNKFVVNQLRKNPFMKWMVNQLPESSKRKVLDRRDKMMGKFLVKEAMDSDLRKELLEHYRPEVDALEKLTGMDLEAWRS